MDRKQKTLIQNSLKLFIKVRLMNQYNLQESKELIALIKALQHPKDNYNSIYGTLTELHFHVIGQKPLKILISMDLGTRYYWLQCLRHLQVKYSETTNASSHTPAISILVGHWRENSLSLIN